MTTALARTGCVSVDQHRWPDVARTPGGPMTAVSARVAAQLLRRNLLIYGVGGLVVPFAGIKLIDMLLTALHLV